MPINWPERYAPRHTAVHVHNELAMQAPPDRVWAWLVRAALWPRWYPNSKDVRIEGGGPDLAPGARFRWRTFGLAVASTVAEFVPNERIAWDGKGIGLDVYHGWLIEPRPDGCRVLTEENQNGAAARLQSLLMPDRMRRGHDLWLARLHDRARSGPPPGP